MLRLLYAAPMLMLMTSFSLAHPHVFVTATLELESNDAGEFTALHHVWKFDELFSSTVMLDFDANGDGSLDATELLDVGNTIKENIAEYDFFTSTRLGTDIASIYAPDTMTASLGENNMVILHHSMRFEKPVEAKEKPLRISVSDPSFYVAFDFTKDAIQMAGAACPFEITVPDFDTLLADPSTMSEAFFDNPDKPDLGDEYYSWIEVQCGAQS